MTRRMPWILERSLTVVLMLVALPGWAYPRQVADILRNSGQSGSAQPSSLDAGVKAQIKDIARDAAAKTGAKAYIVVLKEAEDPADFAAIYDDLQMTGKDLLIVTNGPKWELRTNALMPDVKRNLLQNGMNSGKPVLDRLRLVAQDSATAIAQAKTGQMTWNEFQHANASRGWTSGQMSAAYSRYKAGQPYDNASNSGTLATTSATHQVPAVTQPTAQGSGGHGFLWFLLVVAIGVAGWVLYRRRQRDQGLGEEMKKALAAPEATMADVWMGLDESHPRYAALVDEASAVDAAIKEIKGATPTRENIARLRSLTERAQQLRIAADRK
jgi:hypothetical protein